MKRWGLLGFAAVMPLPWLIARFGNLHIEASATALFSGLAILGAAFLLSWAAEVVEMDVSQALALAMIAFIAVLPEYSVDMYFSWRAGQDPSYSAYAVANMTGANRLLIGLGWGVVVLIFLVRARQKGLKLDRSHGLELGVLALATLYAFSIPIKGNISLIDAVVLVALFVAYIIATSRSEVEEPELGGPAAAIGALPVGPRRMLIGVIFLYAASGIFLSAEPFAEALISTGRVLHVNEFVLVQWLAPLASEAPEFIVATLFAFRGKPQLGLRCIVSSTVNQWTLLVGTLPIVYNVSLRQIAPLTFDRQQVQEVFLTASQSAFALVLIAGFTFSIWSGLALFLLFAVQLIFPDTRWYVAGVYLVFAVALIAASPERRRGVLQYPGFLLSAVRRQPAVATEETGPRGELARDMQAADDPSLEPAGELGLGREG